MPVASRAPLDAETLEKLTRLRIRLRAVVQEQSRVPSTPLDLALAAGFDPDPWQRGVLGHPVQRLILLCSRQAGKSTTSSMLALHSAMRGGLCLVLSPTERQSIELVRKAKESLSGIGTLAATVERESDTTIQFGNGGRLIALPGAKEENIRGFSGVDLLLIDEASRVSDALYRAVRPMLAVSRGRLVLLSTPFGKRGFFYEAWEKGGEAWDRVKVTAHDCPRISDAFLAEERATMGELSFKSEYLCEFVDTEESAFASVYIDAALDETVLPLFGAAA